VISSGGLYRLKYGAWDLDLSAEMHDLMNRQGLNLTRLLHLGAEFGRSFGPRIAQIDNGTGRPGDSITMRRDSQAPAGTVIRSLARR